MQPEDLLKELHECRVERTGKFVPYDRERHIKRREKELWTLVGRWYAQAFEPEKFKAMVASEAAELKRIEAMNRARQKPKKVA